MLEEYRIGMVGLDRGRVSLPVNYEEVMAILDFLKKNKKTDKNIILITEQKAVVMVENNRFLCGYEPKTQSPYMSIEIFARTPDGNNLKNMRMQEFIMRYDITASALKKGYGICIPEDRKKYGTFTELEVNLTFPVRFPFNVYARYLRLLSTVIGGQISTYEVAGKDINDAIEKESILCQHGTYAVRIYNKGKQLEKKINCKSLNYLMRLEFVYLKGQIIVTDFGKISFWEISDEMLTRAFQKRFSKFFNNIEKYLQMKLKLAPGIGKQDTVANVIARNCRDGFIINHAGILAELLAYEIQYSVPCLYDIRDIEIAVNNLQLKGILTMQCTKKEHTDSFLYREMHFTQGTLQYQHELEKEIISNVYSPLEKTVFLDQ